MRDLSGTGQVYRFTLSQLLKSRAHRVTLIIMETFIAKMRRLKGIRKVILIEECWKALMSANMSEYIKYL